MGKSLPLGSSIAALVSSRTASHMPFAHSGMCSWTFASTLSLAWCARRAAARTACIRPAWRRSSLCLSLQTSRTRIQSSGLVRTASSSLSDASLPRSRSCLRSRSSTTAERRSLISTAKGNAASWTVPSLLAKACLEGTMAPAPGGRIEGRFDASQSASMVSRKYMCRAGDAAYRILAVSSTRFRWAAAFRRSFSMFMSATSTSESIAPSASATSSSTNAFQSVDTVATLHASSVSRTACDFLPSAFLRPAEPLCRLCNAVLASSRRAPLTCPRSSSQEQAVASLSPS
mmetsp:Transcript_55987/g.173950  ORF Transcript_55987/g.173950 Transcript_55987/m.173950 type:complete len:288 (+) Transcript_55987:668-1531(+)